MAMIDSSIQYLKGVGPAFAKKFEKLGVTTIRDLLLCYPRKYIDYTKPYTVVSAPYDVDSCVRATVLQKEPVRRIKGGRALVRVLAAQNGLYASFMPKPLKKHSGSGLHVNMSLQKDGQNIFVPADQGHSPQAESFIAGILDRIA